MFPGLTDTITDTAPHNVFGCFALDILTDTIISQADGSLSGFAGVTYPAGRIIYCSLRSLTLASGSVLVYRTGTAEV